MFVLVNHSTTHAIKSHSLAFFFRPPGARNRPSDAPPGSVGSNGVYKTAKTPVGISPKGPPPGAADNAGGGELSKSALKNKKRKEAKKVAEKVMDLQQLPG